TPMRRATNRSRSAGKLWPVDTERLQLYAPARHGAPQCVLLGEKIPDRTLFGVPGYESAGNLMGAHRSQPAAITSWRAEGTAHRSSKVDANGRERVAV